MKLANLVKFVNEFSKSVNLENKFRETFHLLKSNQHLAVIQASSWAADRIKYQLKIFTKANRFTNFLKHLKY